MARVPGATGVIGVDDLGKIAATLKAQGLSTEGIEKILPSLVQAGVGTAAAAPGLLGRLGQGVGGFVSTLPAAVTSEFVASRLMGGAPTAYAQASPEPAGRGFLTTTQEQLAVQQYVATENFRRQALNAARVPLGMEPLPLLDAQDFIESASAVKERELGGATERKIQEIEASRQFDVTLAEIARQAEIEKQRIASQAEVARQREQSLGDIQRQRVESSYQTASDVLNQTIKDVVARERYENNTALAELARAI